MERRIEDLCKPSTLTNVIGSFNFWIALILIAVTGAIGYIGGFALAALWSWLHREPDQFVAGHGERLTPVSGQDCRSQC